MDIDGPLFNPPICKPQTDLQLTLPKQRVTVAVKVHERKPLAPSKKNGISLWVDTFHCLIT